MMASEEGEDVSHNLINNQIDNNELIEQLEQQLLEVPTYVYIILIYYLLYSYLN